MEIVVHLKPAQARKIAKGGVVQLSASQVMGTCSKSHPASLLLHPEMHRKISKAMRARKGVRIQLSPTELEQNGEGLRDIWKGIKKGAKWLKKNVIDSDFYQENLRPIARKAVEYGIDQFAPAPAQELLKKGARKIGDKTSAFGMKRPRGRPRKTGGAMYIESDYRDRANPFNPAMFSPIPTMSIPGQLGGSFRAI